MMTPLPELFFITAQYVIEQESWAEVHPFRGIAFISPLSGHWCDLKTGCVACSHPKPRSFRVFSQRAIHPAWVNGLHRRFPAWLIKELSL